MKLEYFNNFVNDIILLLEKVRLDYKWKLLFCLIDWVLQFADWTSADWDVGWVFTSMSVTFYNRKAGKHKL
jgi:hypothetical protein